MKNLSDRHLYGILDLGYVAAGGATSMTRRMLEGGVDILQLRAKKFLPGEIRALAGEILPICREFEVPLILNDHPDLVPLTGADGVHVGQDDLPVPQVRKIVGPDAIIGLSTHSLDQAVSATQAGPDYIGFGPLFSTPTKPDYAPIGVDEIRRVHEQVALPVFCIGGIKLENLPAVLAAGAMRVVIVSGILQAADVLGYCKKCRALIGNFAVEGTADEH
ncbi:MAG: thiamine phosphate synthase [Verrucomicrobia bacterium]|nr:thiamine phosphate synthase [Verrucomicrobiota bacterium]